MCTSSHKPRAPTRGQYSPDGRWRDEAGLGRRVRDVAVKCVMKHRREAALREVAALETLRHDNMRLFRTVGPTGF